MRILKVGLFLVLAMNARAATAEAPQFVADILPIHSLVAQVMEVVGAQTLIMPPGASPHYHAMRPSEAAAVSRADLVVWVGPELTPWMDRAVDALADDAVSLALFDLDETEKLPFREGAIFEVKDDHDDGHGHGHNHGNNHGHNHGRSHDDHDHGDGMDPHVWLDPDNAEVWLTKIADELSKIDPANAATYAQNAEKARAGLTDLAAEIETIVAPVQERPFRRVPRCLSLFRASLRH